jgi:hypothetical protein
MEHISTVVSRVLPDLHRSARPSALVDAITRRPRNLFELIRTFEAEEAHENEDIVTPLAGLRLTPEGLVDVPDRGQFVFTDWSQRQCSTLLGVRWDRWFENCSSAELAVDVNRRFARARGSIRLRTVRARDAEPGVDGILRAFVSPGYTAIADSRVASLVETALSPIETDLPIIRVDQTDRSTTFVVGVGKPYRIGGPGNVGDVWGGLLIRNSGVGFASLLISMHLTRLLCKNGMVAPLPDAIVVRKRHRFFDDSKLRGVLAEQLRELPGKLSRGADLLATASERALTATPEAEIRGLLEQAGLPRRLAEPILGAYHREPHPTAFGISQAVTLASQSMTPEERFELERAAGTYLAAN